MIRDKNGETFARKELVLALANKDGGAHVDPQLDERYASLSRLNSLGWQVQTGDIRLPPDNSVVAANVRQIAYELLTSLEGTFPDLALGPGGMS